MTAHPLDRVHVFTRRFISYPSPEALDAHVLWIGHTHLMELWDSTPRLAFLSPEPGSGKSRALEVTKLLVPRPVETVNATPAYLFRKVADPFGPPTLLYDEIDTLFGPRAKDNEDVRGMLNAGHRRGGTAGRCVMKGKVVETEELPAYCAVAMAGLGNLPDTITTRSVIITMRRRAPKEVVEPFRERLQREEAASIRTALSDWAERISHVDFPDMPKGIADRDADVWEALIAVADLAGGEWPARARAAAMALVAASKDKPPGLGVLLLADVRRAFGVAEQISTEDLLGVLNAWEDAPWGDLKGKALDSRRLAQLLRPYEVKSRQIRIGSLTIKGYRQVDLHDAWSRYLQSLSRESETSVTGVTAWNSSTHEPGSEVPDVSHVSRVADTSHSTKKGECPRCQDTGCNWCAAPGTLFVGGANHNSKAEKTEGRCSSTAPVPTPVGDG